MSDTEQRFGLTMGGIDRDEPGLVRERDGTVWLVNPDGTRTQLPGGGASQPGAPRLIGPIPLLFSDIPNSGDRFDLLTLPVGSALIDWWIDPDTVVPFTPDENDMDFGQGAGWAAEGAGRIGRFANIATQTTDGSWGVDSANRTNLDGTVVRSALLVTKDASPIQVQTFGGGAPYAAGSIDLYFLVVTPPFATS